MKNINGTGIPKRLILIFSTVIFLLGITVDLTVPGHVAAQGESPQPRVDPQVLESLQASGSADFVIEMAEQADLSAAYAITDWNERGQYVVDTLKAVADRSQKGAVSRLKGQGARFTSYTVSNAIVVHGGSQRALEAVQNLPEVARVRAPVVVQLEPAEELLRRAVDISMPQAVLAGNPTWGLVDTGALRFWSAYMNQGEGIIVANIDSGVQYDHPVLAAAYRCLGTDLPPAACWKDATSTTAGNLPSDNLGHGTHTMGSMVGTDTEAFEPSVGMAPRAEWIACKAFANNEGKDTDILTCAQWILAPGSNPANRPHVVNNSWGGGTTSDPLFLDSVKAWRAAGIFPVFSAGNLTTKTGCVKMGSPADYPESFSVGAHDIYGVIAYFSLNGSDGFNTSFITKPNLSAPGVSVYSSLPTNTYGYYSGTSMASPHAAGAVALLWSCNPGLVGQIDLTFQLLQNNTDVPPPGSCGAPDSGLGNYTYGYGYLNVYQSGLGVCPSFPATYLPLILR